MSTSSQRSHKSICDHHPSLSPVIQAHRIQSTFRIIMNDKLPGPLFSRHSILRPLNIRLWTPFQIFDGVSQQLRRIWRFFPDIKSLWNSIWQRKYARKYDWERPLSRKSTTLKQCSTSLSQHSKQQQARQRKLRAVEILRRRQQEYRKSNEMFQRVLQPKVFRQSPAFQFHCAVSEIPVHIGKNQIT